MTNETPKSTQQNLDIHEAICEERYEDLSRDIKALKADIKEVTVLLSDLQNKLSKGSGAISMLFILGIIISAIYGLFQIFKGVN